MPQGRRGRTHEIDISAEVLKQIDNQGEAVYTKPDDRLLLRGRELAYRMVDSLSAKINSLTNDDLLFIRLDRVTAMASFVEIVVQNLVCGDTPETRIMKGKSAVLVNPDEDTTISIHRALMDQKDVCLVLKTTGPEWELSYLGSVQQNLQDVVNFIRLKEKVTSADVAKEFKIQTGDASRRLKELFEDGILRRRPDVSDKGSLTFVYSYFHPSLARDPKTPPELTAPFFYTIPKMPRHGPTAAPG
jgi:predicted DNA-binding transcriptional regulator